MDPELLTSLYKFFLWGIIVFFSVFLILSINTKLYLQKSQILPFLGLCTASILYAGNILFIMNKEYQYIGRYDFTNACNTLSAAFYVLCMARYLKIQTKVPRTLLAVFCTFASIHVVSLVWNFLSPPSPLVLLEAFPTVNILVLATGSDISPTPLELVILTLQLPFVIFMSIYFIYVLSKERKLLTEKVLLCGLIINLIIQVNELLVGTLPDMKYLIPVLPFTYVFEASRLFIHNQYQAVKKSLTLEGELIEANIAAELSILAGGVLHDLRNPLSIAQMATNSLKKSIRDDDTKPEKLEKRILQLDKACNRMAFIADRYLEILRGTSDTETREVALDNVVEEALSMCQPKIAECKVREVRWRKSSVRTMGNEGALLMAIVNLINNACEAVQELEERSIAISCEETNSKAILSIQDSGPGIPENIAINMFKRKFSTKKDRGGSGLGLDVVQSLLQKQGASIKLDQHAPSTTFVITLPKKFRQAG